MTDDRASVAVFRPDDGRLSDAAAFLRELGVEPVADAMLAIEPTGDLPRRDADFVVVTSSTGVDILADAGWTAGDATLCAIGERTADALTDAGYEVAVVPEDYCSSGMADALRGRAPGHRVEIARSDRGGSTLPNALDDMGAYHHETVLYRLARPDEAGVSGERAAEGTLDGALFTSGLTVEHFLAAADDRGVREDAIEGLEDAVVATLTESVRETAESEGLTVDVVPETTTFEAMARAVVERV